MNNKEIAEKLSEIVKEQSEINASDYLPFKAIPLKQNAEEVEVILRIQWANRLSPIIKSFFADSRPPSEIDRLIQKRTDLSFLNSLDNEFWDMVENDVQDHFEDIINNLITLIKEKKRSHDLLALMPITVRFQTDIYADLYQVDHLIM